MNIEPTLKGGVTHGPVRLGRLSPIVEGDFVLLLIGNQAEASPLSLSRCLLALGVKPHNLLQFWKWMPIVRAMVHMGKVPSSFPIPPSSFPIPPSALLSSQIEIPTLTPKLFRTPRSYKGNEP